MNKRVFVCGLSVACCRDWIGDGFDTNDIGMMDRFPVAETGNGSPAGQVSCEAVAHNLSPGTPANAFNDT